MLRWLVLLLMLANSLLLFWYAQKYRFAEPDRLPDINPKLLRMPTELDAFEVLIPRTRECALYLDLSSEYEARRLVELLATRGYAAAVEPMPARLVGLRLDYPLPADAEARIRVLDRLARSGWVPETRDGALVLGAYESEAELAAVKQQLPEDIASGTRVRRVLAPSGQFQVAVSYLIGYEITSEINQIVKNGWPGIKFEKKVCSGVASSKVDQ